MVIYLQQRLGLLFFRYFLQFKFSEISVVAENIEKVLTKGRPRQYGGRLDRSGLCSGLMLL